MPQLRQNIITGDWVVIAPERAKRPSEFIAATQVRGPKDGCVFCPESENFKKNRLHAFETDHIYVIPNKFPAFVEDPDRCSERSYRVENGFFLTKPALGGHDVVVIKSHELALADFNRPVWRDLFVIFRKRYQHYDQVCNNEYTMAIYNEGSASGASIVHPHAQIFSSNIVPNLISQELAECERYWQVNSRSSFTELVAHEKKYSRRVLAENDYYIGFIQYAARFPFETWIVPKYQLSRFDKISPHHLAAIVPVVEEVMKKINRKLNKPPLNFYIHSAPNSIEEAEYYRWHIEIVPRLSNFGGYELGSGVVINVFSPEVAADFLNSRP